jgi:hypothetical protein
LPARKLEAELARVDVESVQSEADARRDLRLDLSHFRTKHSGVIVTTASKLDVEAGTKNGADESGLDGGRGHTLDHDWRLSQKL